MNRYSRANPPSGDVADVVHPGAWWAWSLALGAAATRTTNPLILMLLIAVAGFVVNSRRSPESSRTFWFFVRLGVVIIAARIVFDIVFGAQHTGYVVLHLPSVPLPNWAAGLHLGGAITTQALLTRWVRRPATCRARYLRRLGKRVGQPARVAACTAGQPV